MLDIRDSLQLITLPEPRFQFRLHRLLGDVNRTLFQSWDSLRNGGDDNRASGADGSSGSGDGSTCGDVAVDSMLVFACRITVVGTEVGHSE